MPLQLYKSTTHDLGVIPGYLTSWSRYFGDPVVTTQDVPGRPAGYSCGSQQPCLLESRVGWFWLV